MSRVVIIGGGPAGCMAAIAAAEKGHDVILCEKNEKIGKKLFITGKGRCNVTNDCDMEVLFQNIVSNEKFLYSAFYSFTNKNICYLLEEVGCRLKTERGGRVFPVSDHSSDVIKALQEKMRNCKVKVRYASAVKNVQIHENNITGVTISGGEKIEADAVVIATGGISYPITGSDGDGYKMAKTLGISVTDVVPALVPFESKEEWCKSLQGLSLKNVEASLVIDGKEKYREFGEMLFTHFGVSGPLVLSASSFYAKQKKKETVFLNIDLKPALSEEQLDKRLLRDFEENKKKQFKNALSGLFPAKLIPVMIQLSGIDAEKKVQDITKEERKQFVALIKALKVSIAGTRDFNEAIVTQGGVSVKEINPSTMESKKIKGLYFAGEVLDLDGLTGGFNLQIAWSTGHLAGESIL